MEQLPIIRNDHPKDIVLATWSFLPEWAHTLRPQINARGETVATHHCFGTRLPTAAVSCS